MSKNIELACQMIRKGVTQAEIATAIGRSEPYVAARMHGHRPWNIDEVYAICKLLGIEHGEIPTYFPPGKGAA